jgi:outer membrane protein assembly factor BamB
VTPRSGVLLLALAASACGVAAPDPVTDLPDGAFPAAGGSGGSCDADHDGYDALACGGLDCDDTRATVSPVAAEGCGNGIDDDCDGLIDEDCGCTPGDLQACWEGATEKRGVGACTDGVRRCGADRAWGPCAFAVGPTAESGACDGIDSDCDGVKDPPACAACPPDAQEICGNGLDDDCDGRIDPPELCTASCDGVNPRGGDGGAMACCLRSPPAVTEFQCHEGEGLDACADRACLDLDGSLDTRCSKLCDQTGCVCGRRQSSGQIVAVADCGFLTPCARMDCGDRQNQPCYSGPPATLGVGVCHGGTHSCEDDAGRKAWNACIGEQTPGPEICGNGLDDDCDGWTDEEDGATGKRCGSGPTCDPAALERCGNGLDDDCDGFADEGCVATSGRQSCWTGPLEARGIGPCKDGVQTDENGAWSACTGQVLPAPEVCGDGIDSDCDGLGGPKEPEEPSCCVPQAEVCNGRDDDCDGRVDEDLLNRCGQCPGTGSCYGVSFDDAGDCARPGRACEGVEPSRLDPALITLAPSSGSTAGAGETVLYVVRTMYEPTFHYQVVQVDPATGEVRWAADLGDAYTGEPAVAADGSIWLRHSYDVEHRTADGKLLCVTDKVGTEFVENLAPDPGGDMWMLRMTSTSYAVRRYAAQDVLLESSPGVPWPDGIPRCAPVDLDPASASTDLPVTGYGAIVLDAKARVWALTSNPWVWDAGVLTLLPAGNNFFTSPVLAPSGDLLAGWPLRRIQPDAWIAGEPDAVKELGSYGYNIANQVGLADGSIAAVYYPSNADPWIYHLDGATGAELGRFKIPGDSFQFYFSNLAVDGNGALWTGSDDLLHRLDLASGVWDTFHLGGHSIMAWPLGAGLGGAVAGTSRGTWTQDVDAGSYRVQWGELSFEARASGVDHATVSVRFADDPAALADSKVVCGPLSSSPSDLSACSHGLRFARVEIHLAGSGQPVAGHLHLSWDRPL